MFDFDTKYGHIHFSGNAINKIITEAVESCGTKAEILNYKGKYKHMVPGLASKMNLYNEELGGIQVSREDDGIHITVYVVIRFGASIKKTTEQIIDYIYDNMEKMMGERPANVKVVVTGTLSKNIAKRHIEVSR